MSPVIRRLVPGDVPAVVELTVAAWAPVAAAIEAQLSPALLATVYPDRPARQARTVRELCADPDHLVWVALREDDLPVGVVVVGLLEEDLVRAAEILLLAVHPDHQQSGIGEALVRLVLRQVRALGVHLSVVTTGGDLGHAPARSLYEKLGYRPLPLVRYYRAMETHLAPDMDPGPLPDPDR